MISSRGKVEMVGVPMKVSLSKHIASRGAILLALLLGGCATPAHRVDSSGRELITTVGGVDIQDAADAATKLSESLLASGVFGQNEQPALIGVDRFVNSTDQSVDPDYILKRIRVALSKAGAAKVVTSIGETGEIGGESAVASRAAGERLRNQQIDAFLNETEVPECPKPDYALTFKMLDNCVQAEGVQQVTHIFQMSLTDVRTGVAVWEDERRITKQGSRSALGR